MNERAVFFRERRVVVKRGRRRVEEFPGCRVPLPRAPPHRKHAVIAHRPHEVAVADENQAPDRPRLSVTGCERVPYRASASRERRQRGVRLVPGEHAGGEVETPERAIGAAEEDSIARQRDGGCSYGALRCDGRLERALPRTDAKNPRHRGGRGPWTGPSSGEPRSVVGNGDRVAFERVVLGECRDLPAVLKVPRIEPVIRAAVHLVNEKERSSSRRPRVSCFARSELTEDFQNFPSRHADWQSDTSRLPPLLARARSLLTAIPARVAARSRRR